MIREWMLSAIAVRLRRAMGFVFLFCAAGISAGERNYYFDPHDSELGLVQHSINQFFQDREGYMWIATQGGLHRYDGKRLRLYEHDAADPASLPDSFVVSVDQDSRGALWVGGSTGGVARLDPASGKAQSFALPADAAAAEERNAIGALKFDSRRGLWIATRAGIELLDTATGARREVARFPVPLRDGLGGPQLDMDADGTVWVATSKGLLRILPGSDSAQPIATDSIGAARSTIVARDGSLIVATHEGLFRLLPQHERAERFWPDAAIESGHSHDAYAVVQDATGKFWIAALGEGLAVFDPASGRTEWLHNDPNVPGALPEKYETDLFLDRSGLLWVGGVNRGFATVDPAGARFRLLLDIRTDQPVSSTSNYVRALFEDTQQRLWLGTEGAELKRYDPVRGEFDYFTDTLLQALGTARAPPTMHVSAIGDAGGGRLWVAANTATLLLDTDRRSASVLRVGSTQDEPMTEARELLVARDGSLWLGSSHGLAHRWPGTERWEFFRHVPGGNDSLANDFVVSAKESRDGRIWIATIDGLSVYDPAQRSLRSFRHDAADPQSLSDSFVHTVHQAADGKLWVGTNSGLNRLDDESGGKLRFTRYLARDGLINATIYSILDDEHGNLWLGTNRGIQLFERSRNIFHAFSLRDGLQGMEFNTDVAQRLANGELAFGGTNGVNLFDPNAVHFSAFKPPVVVTGIQVGDLPEFVQPGSAQRIEVDQTRRVLRFEFAALDYAAPERNQFAYQLEGFDKDWVQAGTRRDATYTNLTAGDYVFRVRASNLDGVWNDEGASLALRIRPPWWDSRSMRALYAGIFGLVLLLTWRTVRRRRETERRHHAELAQRDDRFRMALWGSGDEFWDLDLRSGMMRRIGADQNFGGSYEQTIGDQVWLHDIVHPDDVRHLIQRRQDHLEGRTDSFESEHRVRGADGEWVWRLSRGKIVDWDDDGKPLRASGTARNVTTAYLADRQQRIAAGVLDSMTEAVCVTDLELRCISVNRAFERMTGYSEAQMLGGSAAIPHSSHQGAQAYAVMRDTYIKTGHWRGEAWQRRSNGEEFLAWLEVSAVLDAAGQRTHYVSVMTDITERKRTEQDLRYLANYDPLTGLPNRSLLIERLGEAIDRAHGMNSRVAILFLDLDRFKHVNDSMGHISGDAMLKAVGERLRNCVRGSDTVARIGGDEFTVLIEDLGEPAEAENVANKVIAALAVPLALEGQRELTITPSIGISLYPDHARGAMNLLKFADTAMYQAKEHGRNTYMVYTPAMDTAARRWADTAAALRRALENNEFSVVYQPKLSLRDERICGVEALLRWRSRELGEIPPSHFIPLAEQIGLIVDIGDFVARTACAQLAQWQQMGPAASISIAVNVSVLQLLRGELPARLRQILAEHAIDPRNLQLELTESMLMARAEQAVGTLDELRALGVSLAIDDFGTGYSSLSYLKRLPIDTLKVDQAFVGDLTTDPDDRAITATIITMAHSLGLNVVAEGVETREQLEYLRAQGCDEIQGNWLSPPLSAEACTAFLRERANLLPPRSIN